MNDEQTVKALKAENARLKEDVSALRSRVEWLERQLFGSTSDKRTEHPASTGAEGTAEIQMTLFDEDYLKAYEAAKAEAEASSEEIRRDEEVRKANAKAKAEASSQASRKERRTPRYANLECRTTTLLPEGIDVEECVCIGEDIAEVLRRDPAKFWKEVIRRPKYIKRSEMGQDTVTVYQAQAPDRAIGNCRVGAEIIAWLIINKFQWSLPEYRVAAMLRQQGIDIPTSTINDWIHLAADKLYLLYLRLKARILSRSDYVQADEVPFNINDRKGKIRKGYAWQVNDCSGQHLGRFFHYDKGSREKAVPQGLFVDYRGAVQVDGYQGYDFLELSPSVTLLSCLAHVRRKFTDAEREDPRASYPLDQIHLLYELERQLAERQATPEEIAKERQRKAEPILNLLDAWMEAIQTSVMPKSHLGKAIGYTYRLMPRLRRYCLDGRYHIDNNTCEQGNRTPVIGRKNYLFSANDHYAEDNATFYSLIETCVDLGVDPLGWLTEVLSKPLLDMTDTELDHLLPQYTTTLPDEAR